MIKKSLYILFFFILSSCSNIELVLKDNSSPNKLKGNTWLVIGKNNNEIYIFIIQRFSSYSAVFFYTFQRLGQLGPGPEPRNHLRRQRHVRRALGPFGLWSKWKLGIPSHGSQRNLRLSPPRFRHPQCSRVRTLQREARDFLEPVR